MTDEELDRLREFLRGNVSSFEELEVLLFFVRAPLRPWSGSDIAGVLNLSEEAVEGALQALSSGSRLLEALPAMGRSRAYRYSAPTHLQELLEELRRTYEEQRLSILRIMSTNALDRVRSAAARRLAEAFRLERRKR